MPLNRFDQLCKHLHFFDPNSANVKDKLHEVRPFIKILQENLAKLLHPWQALSVDEAMITFYGRLL
ncbi:unnamed protein product [Oncorhynchus mykiss]|uniref:PiggyBac transposable element-derived protein domain-containing protein n=1 Tax=Oncorhynchus mykiss TaxID=8022 RepID=A0A060WD98_ONCMY|nr:unnamed protein product [Oncorhynchus mykiss]